MSPQFNISFSLPDFFSGCAFGFQALETKMKFGPVVMN